LAKALVVIKKEKNGYFLNFKLKKKSCALLVFIFVVLQFFYFLFFTKSNLLLDYSLIYGKNKAGWEEPMKGENFDFGFLVMVSNYDFRLKKVPSGFLPSSYLYGDGVFLSCAMFYGPGNTLILATAVASGYKVESYTISAPPF